MKTYKIIRGAKGVQVEVEHVKVGSGDGKFSMETYPLVSVGTHGPDFEYGYNGSGPAQLAWSILANYFEESNLTHDEQRHSFFLSNRLHQYFKEDMIARLNQSNNFHTIYEVEVLSWVRRYVTIDLGMYKQRREEFRANSRRLDEIETSPGDHVEEWDKLCEEQAKYMAWMDILREQWLSQNKQSG